MSHWYVLRAQPQTELRTEKQIKDIGYQAMCPYAEGRRRVHRLVRKWRFPLFSGYLFASWEPYGAGWEAIKAIDTVRGILKKDELTATPATLSLADIEYLQSIADGKYISPDDIRSLCVGDQVLIPEGPLEGCLAILKKIRGKEATIEPRLAKNKIKVRIPIAKLRRI